MRKQERDNVKASVDATHASGALPSCSADTTASVVDAADAAETVAPAVPATEELPWVWERSLGFVEHAQMDFDSWG